MSKISEIKFTVQLDEKNLPQKIEWEATDSGFPGKKEASTMMISLWDKEEKVTMGIDLWTKDMLIDDMNKHFHQTFEKMADTYSRATTNKEAADMVKSFSKEFAKKLKLFEKE